MELFRLCGEHQELQILETVYSSGSNRINLAHQADARHNAAIEQLSEAAAGYSVNWHLDSTYPEQRYANLFVGMVTGPPRLFDQHRKDQAYPRRHKLWPDVIMKRMHIPNKGNLSPFCTFILDLQGETREESDLSLDLHHALKYAKRCAISTLFVPHEETRTSERTQTVLKTTAINDLGLAVDVHSPIDEAFDHHS